MTTTYYTGSGASHAGPIDLPTPRHSSLSDPAHYLADPGAIDAVNTTIVLGQPLLLTGEPGSGKTQLAFSVAHELGLPLLRFDTKSTTQARDLFYSYDAVARLSAAQAGNESARALDHLRLQALGLAILLTRDASEAGELLPPNITQHEPTRSVVLIDEIDKAPRDLPNDVLSEIEDFRFVIPELGYRLVAGDPDRPPIVIVTSNSERSLPETFLRRCVYYHMPLPSGERLQRILELRLGDSVQHTPFLKDAVSLFAALRKDADELGRPPSTAELLQWILALRSLDPDAENPLRTNRDLIPRTLGVLVKTKSDHERAIEIVESWLASTIQE